MNAITKTTSEVRQVLVPTTFDQLVIFAEMAAKSGMVPKDYVNKPGAVMVAVQMGSELGLSPMQSLVSIAVINGRPGVWGDGMIGLCRQSPLCEDIVETIEGEGEARTAVCVATRRGSSPTVGRFSVADARRAGLWGKDIWAKYPDRMLQNRARGFALRDAFPDLLRGLKTVEELRDTPPDTFRGTTIEQSAPAPRVSAARTPDARDALNADLDARAQVYATDKPKTRTGRDLLDDVKGQLDAAGDDLAAVEAVAASDMVQKGLGWLKNGGLRELNAILNEAIHRCVRAQEDRAGAVTDEPRPADLDDEIPF